MSDSNGNGNGNDVGLDFDRSESERIRDLIAQADSVNRRQHGVHDSRFWWALTGAAAAVAAVLLVVFLIQYASMVGQERNETSERIDGLQTDLNDTRDELSDAAARLAAVTSCREALLANTSEANAEFLSRQADLVIALALPDTEITRPAVVAEAVIQLETANAAYKVTVAERTDYTRRGAPLPCPVPTSG